MGSRKPEPSSRSFQSLVVPQHVSKSPDQESNVCPLHSQADSKHGHQGSPVAPFNDMIHVPLDYEQCKGRDLILLSDIIIY